MEWKAFPVSLNNFECHGDSLRIQIHLGLEHKIHCFNTLALPIILVVLHCI